MARQFIIMLVSAGLVLGGIFGWKIYSGAQMRQAMSAMALPPATVSTATVRSERWQPVIPAVGSLRALQGVDVTAQLAAQVTELHFESGMAVEQGDLLVSQYTADDEARLDGLIAAAELAETNFERAKKLTRENLVSDTEYDTRRAELQGTRAAEANLRLVIEQKSIRAPFSGRLGIRKVDVGQYVEPGDTLVRLESLEQMLVEFVVPQRYLGQLMPGQVIEVSADAWPDLIFQGELRAIEPQVDRDTRTVRVQGVVENEGQRLVPGMFVEVEIALPGHDAVVTVPQTAVTYSPYGDSVYIVDETEEGALIVRSQAVTRGETRGDQVAIDAGLEPGIVIVTAGQQKLRSGSRIRVDNSVVISDQADPNPANN